MSSECKKVGAGETASKSAPSRSKALAKQPVAVIEAQPELALVPCDENLLECTRSTQWQVGDWQSLTKIN